LVLGLIVFSLNMTTQMYIVLQVEASQL